MNVHASAMGLWSFGMQAKNKNQSVNYLNLNFRSNISNFSKHLIFPASPL